MAQFRVEFVLDRASGKYLAELYSPDKRNELMMRTEAMYPTQAAAVLGLVQMFKSAVKPPKRPKLRKKAKKQTKRRKHR